jgi:hypothetical protein
MQGGLCSVPVRDTPGAAAFTRNGGSENDSQCSLPVMTSAEHHRAIYAAESHALEYASSTDFA